MNSHLPFQGDRSGPSVSGLGSWRHLFDALRQPERPSYPSFCCLSASVALFSCFQFGQKPTISLCLIAWSTLPHMGKVGVRGFRALARTGPGFQAFGHENMSDTIHPRPTARRPMRQRLLCTHSRLPCSPGCCCLPWSSPASASSHPVWLS